MEHGPTDAEGRGSSTSAPPPPRRRTRRRLAAELIALAVVGVLLVAAVALTVQSVYREFYSPSAFVERYLGMLSDGRAAEAMLVPGVAIDSMDLADAGLPMTASDALLRPAAMASLTEVEILDESADGDVTHVSVSYRAGAFTGESTFTVERAGSIGLAPTWRFSQSPLAVLDLTVRGAMSFQVNGFEIDKRQVSPDGVDADPLAPVAMLMFSPGIYSVAVDTAVATSPGVAVLSDSPLTVVPVDLQASPTEEFVTVVQERVDLFLDECAAQEVLQPTACPFGYYVRERIDSPPVWSIAERPVVTIEPDGAGWKIPRTEAVAHIEVGIRSLFDGSVQPVSEDVPFTFTAQIEMLPDGTASIAVGGG
ncbi:hypothetical protein ACFQZV_02065 [Microbacterium koreense]|uniref:DUF2993 domain-containing protein n=1 Tax=Microbacterium koreense TaxID=323761 RepID=A0ABW2ZN81_9MICO